MFKMFECVLWEDFTTNNQTSAKKVEEVFQKKLQELDLAAVYIISQGYTGKPQYL